MTSYYQISLMDVFDHDTVVWEGDNPYEGLKELNSLQQAGYDMSAQLEKVYLDDDGELDYYEVIDEVVWFDNVDEYEQAYPDVVCYNKGNQ